MIGAFIWDIGGSRIEFVKDCYSGKDFALFANWYRFMDVSLVLDFNEYGGIIYLIVVVFSVYEKLKMNLKAKAKLFCQDWKTVENKIILEITF